MADKVEIEFMVRQATAAQMQPMLSGIRNMDTSLQRLVNTNEKVRRTTQFGYSTMGRAIRGAAREMLGFASTFQVAQVATRYGMEMLQGYRDTVVETGDKQLEFARAIRQTRWQFPTDPAIADMTLDEFENRVKEIAKATGKDPAGISMAALEVLSAKGSTTTVSEALRPFESLSKYRWDLDEGQMKNWAAAMMSMQEFLDWDPVKSLGFLTAAQTEVRITDPKKFAQTLVPVMNQMADRFSGENAAEEIMALMAAGTTVSGDVMGRRTATSTVRFMQQAMKATAPSMEPGSYSPMEMMEWFWNTPEGQKAAAGMSREFYKMRDDRGNYIVSDEVRQEFEQLEKEKGEPLTKADYESAQLSTAARQWFFFIDMLQPDMNKAKELFLQSSESLSLSSEEMARVLDRVTKEMDTSGTQTGLLLDRALKGSSTTLTTEGEMGTRAQAIKWIEELSGFKYGGDMMESKIRGWMMSLDIAGKTEEEVLQAIMNNIDEMQRDRISEVETMESATGWMITKIPVLGDLLKAKRRQFDMMDEEIEQLKSQLEKFMRDRGMTPEPTARPALEGAVPDMPGAGVGNLLVPGGVGSSGRVAGTAVMGPAGPFLTTIQTIKEAINYYTKNLPGRDAVARHPLSPQPGDITPRTPAGPTPPGQAPQPNTGMPGGSYIDPVLNVRIVQDDTKEREGRPAKPPVKPKIASGMGAGTFWTRD